MEVLCSTFRSAGIEYTSILHGVVAQADNLAALKALPTRSIDLIYIDPPYGCDRDREFGMPKWHSTEEHYQFCDKLGLGIIRKIDKKKRSNAGIAHYLSWLYPRLKEMHRVLKDTGSIYVHLDYRMVHFVKLMMDEIFGRENFRNEIVWHYISGGLSEKTFGKKHDVILFYSKTNEYVFNQLRELKNKYKNIDSSKFLEDEKGKFVWYIRPGTNPKVPEGVKVYIEGIIHDVWDIPIVNPQAEERKFTGNYPTQKPEKLIERIILASSNEGDIVADFFCGSGTTAAVAEKLNRYWLCVDNNPKAFEVTKQRLSKIQPRLF